MLVRFQTLQGQQLKATDGPIGDVRAFYFNDESWAICYLILQIGRWINFRNVLIPPAFLEKAQAESKNLTARLSRSQIKRSAPIELKKAIPEQGSNDRSRRNRLHLISNPPEFAGSATRSPSTPVRHLTGSTADHHLRSSEELSGNYWVTGEGGDIGPVHDFVVDEQAWSVRYLVVDTGWWFAASFVFLPASCIRGISARDRTVSTSLAAGAVRNGPRYQASIPLDEFETQINDYWKAQRRRTNEI
jgi:hypothetical protein